MSAIISIISQIKGIKKHVCWINNYNEHDATSFLSDYNDEKFIINF